MKGISTIQFTSYMSFDEYEILISLYKYIWFVIL